MEDVLFYGAHLIMALGIRKPFHNHDEALNVQPCSPQTESPSKVTIVRPHFDPISLPSWTTTRLVLNQYSADWKHEANEQLQDCIFIGVFDTENVHALEYVIESNDSGVSVQYARVHEYLRGTPQISEPVTNQNGQVEPYNWLDMPSEDVYYYTAPLTSDAFRRDTPLVSWQSPSVEVFDYHNPGTVEPAASARPSIKPAKRYFESEVPWRDVSFRCLPRIFPVAFGRVMVRAYNKRSQGNSKPTISRPCTYRRGAIDEERRRNGQCSVSSHASH
jgi:hypothetical protein